jgi:UTP--glucose-1-phosphate uridylyltransferase
MKARFPHGAPSLIDCEKLVVEGDVLFGQHVVIKGNVHITNKEKRQIVIPDGAIIEG